MKSSSWVSIDVTKSLLDQYRTDPRRLTNDEQEAVKSHISRRDAQNKRWREANDEIRHSCKILCSGPEKDMIPSSGWIEPLKSMSYKLEKLNLENRKYDIKVVFYQAKAKYGEYSGYYRIECESNTVIGYAAKILGFIGKYLQKVDYGQKFVTDKEAFTTKETEEISEEEYKMMLSSQTMAKLVFIKDGKHFKTYDLYHRAETHIEFTKHLRLKKVSDRLLDVKYWLECHDYRPDKKTLIHREVFSDEVAEIVKKAEDDCMNHCEVCGNQIGDKSFSPTCITTGWIAYLCRSCAMAQGHDYSRNGINYIENRPLISIDKLVDEE